ncbi:MAG: DUF3696 domain-containing protein [Methylococcales bacterium]|nr:DUF3696 domain-containing protein [Methylococcales bacterium]MDP3008372.1 DUF3696 domain-containing protein [Methylococcales bacterium]MDP3838104.1 DUF3696 domain-containing protein [Methylococcales bacterium]
MLNSLNLKHFKCFESLHLPLAPLTLLSGTNASGKSSILQALVLLHQTMREHEWSTRLMLNGKSIKLGTVLDVVNESHGGKSFEIGLMYKNISYSWAFTGERNELSMDVEKICIINHGTNTPIEYDYPKLKKEHPDHIAPNYLQKLLPTYYTLARHDFHVPFSSGKRKDNFVTDIHQPLTTGFTYITAERIGPREVYVLEDRHIAYAVGPMGEYAMSLFYSKRDEPILDDLVLETESRNTLFHQVTAQMQQFFPNCLLAVEKVQNVNAVTLRLKTSNETEFHRPINVGFGLTQVLPIVIAALSAQKEDILLIENPEVHLHPAGQALMGKFLAKVASTGVQVIIETHSDHILNGIRRFVKAGGISHKDVALHFFRARSADVAQVISPQINANGDLDCWPDGFFDQFDKDMNHFAGWD